MKTPLPCYRLALRVLLLGVFVSSGALAGGAARQSGPVLRVTVTAPVSELGDPSRWEGCALVAHEPIVRRTAEDVGRCFGQYLAAQLEKRGIREIVVTTEPSASALEPQLVVRLQTWGTGQLGDPECAFEAELHTDGGMVDLGSLRGRVPTTGRSAASASGRPSLTARESDLKRASAKAVDSLIDALARSGRIGGLAAKR